MLLKKISDRTGLFTILILVISLAACNLSNESSPATATPTPPLPTAVTNEPVPTPTAVTGQTAQGQAYIESLEVTVLESDPVQVQASISGNLSDSCTALEGVNVELMGVTYVLDVITSYSDIIACTQALVPFEQTVQLEVAGLPDGTYSVSADNLSETFTLTADNSMASPTPVSVAASLSVTPDSGRPGDPITLVGNGFPAAAVVEIGFGRVNSEYDIIAEAQADANGAFTLKVGLPDFAESGDQWLFVAVVNNTTMTTSPIAIVPANGGTSTPLPDADVNVPVNGRFVRTYMYLIALEDGGQSGEMIGCNDSAIPVIIEIEPTVAPMTAAINRLLSLSDQYYGQSGLYNSLYQSDLTLEGINIVNREARISLTGTIQLSGACDNPRVLAQIEYTARQYSTVDSVNILLNGQPLESQLGGQ